MVFRSTVRSSNVPRRNDDPVITLTDGPQQESPAVFLSVLAVQGGIGGELQHLLVGCHVPVHYNLAADRIAPAGIITVIMNENLTTSKNGLEFIANWEGCILKPYKDIAGLRTIGIGHLIKPGENFPDGVTITKEQALDLLAQDVKLCEDAIKKHIKVVLNQNQFDALVSFGFNCGVGVYMTSGACVALNAGRYAEVPTQLLSWSKAKINGVLQTVQGLYNRRKSEGQLFMKAAEAPVAASDPLVPWTKDGLKEAQEKLKKIGLYSKSIDGIWGPGTSAGVTSFATSLGVTLQDPSRGLPASVLKELKSR